MADRPRSSLLGKVLWFVIDFVSDVGFGGRNTINVSPKGGERIGTNVIVALHAFKNLLIKLQSKSWCFHRDSCVVSCYILLLSFSCERFLFYLPHYVFFHV